MKLPENLLPEMEEAIVQYFSEGTDFDLPLQDSITLWLQEIGRSAQKEISFLNFIFCDDEYLLEMNRQYLGHDYYTDVITFPYSEDESAVEGDIYISIERVADNAAGLGIPFDLELHRVMVHGFLHLLGYDDHGVDAKEKMTEKEDECLSRLSSLLSSN